MIWPALKRLAHAGALRLVVAAEPNDLGLGKGPAEMSIGEGDPEAIRPESIEVTDLARAILGLARAATLVHQELDDRIPVPVQA